MELSELAAYAEEKYQMKEEHKWNDFRGFSVLADPRTGKWVALLMRQWDYETGTELQRCDIKCGRHCIEEFEVPYVGNAFRMKGNKWVGVLFDGRTEPAVVFKLFDRAVKAGEKRGFTVVLDDAVQSGEAGRRDVRDNGGGYSGNSGRAYAGGKTYKDTLLDLEAMRGNYDRRRVAEEEERRKAEEKRLKAAEERRKAAQGAHRLPGRGGGYVTPSFRNTGLFADGQQDVSTLAGQIPPRILEMMKLYEYGSSSFEHKCRNFCRQGKFMEDYEDDAPWSGEFVRYFTTYHDLNLNQLRGYFAWRTLVRRGNFRRITTSLAYMYIYELLNGIGAETPMESLRKMKEFEAGYLDSGVGDPAMRENLRRWMMQFAILNDFSVEEVKPYIDSDGIKRDLLLAVLRRPQDHTDEEIYGALSALTGSKIERSSAVLKEPERAKHLFAEVWRYMSEHYEDDGWDIFTACFGKMKKYPWHPLANAVYLDREDRRDSEYAINDCRKYVYKNRQWSEMRYEPLFFDKYRIHAIVHEADRQLRRYLKTGHYLRSKKGEEWITPFVEAVIEADKAAIEEAARPKIRIDLSGLEKIRRDAQITRDSLLTEEEMQEQHAISAAAPSAPFDEVSRPETAARPEPVPIELSAGAPSERAPEPAADQTKTENMRTPVHNPPNCVTIEFPSLDEVHAQILQTLMRGGSAAELIRSSYLMPSVVADTINEALFDEIGDNVLECDGDNIMLVEDYREELSLILEGDN